MPFQAVLFDCDGVLVDSEPITNGVLRDLLEERGWPISQDECARLFIGHTVREMRGLIEHHTGKPFSETWLQSFYERRNAALEQRLVVMEGAHEAVVAARAHTQDAIACASGADRFKVEMQLRKVGHLGVAAERCLVIEDTAPGATAGLAAGATVWGLCPHGDGRAFTGLPVHRLLRHMGDLAQALA
jgi:beta-phosphoglucomutase-like phosphatase (HAD superfamily)